MKFLKFILSTSILLCFVINMSAQGANWEYYGEPQNGSFKGYYDSESITNTPKGTIMVWTKFIIDHSRTDWVLKRAETGLSAKGYENLSHTIALSELNCKTKEHHNISIFDYDLSGNVLDSYTFTIEKWSPIPPESVGDALFKKVCNIRTKK